VRAFISHVANRHLHGSWINALPSRFIAELPNEHIERQSSIQEAGRAGGHMWQRNDERRERAPSIFQQINAGRNSMPPRLKPAQIEGRAREIKPVRPEGKLNIGDRVFHEKFGPGTVKRVDHDKLEIAFDKAGVRKVMESFVRME
jgi:DNA helicase-2/ATP-dependent DNA helicase PcrA